MKSMIYLYCTSAYTQPYIHTKKEFTRTQAHDIHMYAKPNIQKIITVKWRTCATQNER